MLGLGDMVRSIIESIMGGTVAEEPGFGTIRK